MAYQTERVGVDPRERLLGARGRGASYSSDERERTELELGVSDRILGGVVFRVRHGVPLRVTVEVVVPILRVASKGECREVSDERSTHRPV